MPMTVREYAETRGYSRVAIYKAIDRSPELENCIYQGVSNGKSAKFIRHKFSRSDTQTEFAVQHCSEKSLGAGSSK